MDRAAYQRKVRSCRLSVRQRRRNRLRCSRRSTDRKCRRLSASSEWSQVLRVWALFPGASEQPMGHQDRPHPCQAPPLALGFLEGNAPLSSWVFLLVPLVFALSTLSFVSGQIPTSPQLLEAAREGCEIMHLSSLALAWRSQLSGQESNWGGSMLLSSPSYRKGD